MPKPLELAINQSKGRGSIVRGLFPHLLFGSLQNLSVKKVSRKLFFSETFGNYSESLFKKKNAFIKQQKERQLIK
jgi:hypothetical protein